MTAINKILNMSLEEYETMYFGAWLRWCESVTIHPIDLQRVLISREINNWYNAEMTKCEEEFRTRVARYDGSVTISIQDLKVCYNDCAFRMFNIAPKSLLAKLRQRQSFLGLMVQGIRIETLAFNAN